MKKNLFFLLGMAVLLLSFFFVPTANSAETIVYSEGFEANNGGFSVSTAGSTAGWQWGVPAATPGPGSAHDGSKCWGTKFGSTMPRPSDESIISGAIKLPQVSANQVIRVRFWAFVSLDGMYDRGQFFVSKDGSSWDSLAQFYNNMETSCDVTPAWHKYEFTIDNSYAANADQNKNIIYLRMRAAAQSSSPTFYCPPYTSDDLSGVYIDDLAITYYDVPTEKKVFSLKAYEDPSAWASCPWVAPWNGTRFEVDNDIYSVARMSSNEYLDFYRLAVPLIAKGDVYPIEVQERESEDSYTDYVELLEIDHAAGVSVAVDEKGAIHSYKPAKLIKPVSALAKGNDVTALLTKKDDKGFAAYNGATVTVNFGKVDVARGATLILGVKGFVLGTGKPQPYSGTPAVVVETMDKNRVWQERGRLLPRFEHSVAAFDLKPFLTAGQKVAVRLRSVSHDVKYHLIDYVAFFADSAPDFSVAEVAPSKATYASQNVLGDLQSADGNYAKMSPGDKISLEFPVKPLAAKSVREFIFVSKGYYEPTSGSYLIYTWDGASWVQRDGHSYNSSYVSRDYDLSLFLPDPDGKYRVRIWQDYQYEGAGIDYVKMMIGANEAPLASAYDYRYNRSVMSELSSSGSGYDTWSSCPRNRVVEVEFTSAQVNIPPTTNPVTVTNLVSLTPTISWYYNDTEGNPQVSIEVQVWTGPNATGVILWNPPEILTGSSVVYAGNALDPGVTYYARVRANDGKDWGPWSEASFVITPRDKCDMNKDGQIDRTDINLIMTGRGLNAPGDPRDIDGDGWITVNDARGCTLRCTNPKCAP
ncbi:hypothetical protein SAMN04489760_1517 [Syntrophus gentianae]|uniref:Fibronectin type-III domain-containing protein n=1 Tax=Syntrophus gentianae TaxID=43775 RepID=A0A1H8BEL5_9BACT|nr:fibronectin type III domain-containing protein [Syntrophus gentianae]SEM80889.1 hypothetical protein SAMN04489760_1517 [Syntrophus gentianae]